MNKGITTNNDLEYYIDITALGDPRLLLYDESASAFIDAKIDPASFDYGSPATEDLWYLFTVSYDGSGSNTGIRWFVNNIEVSTILSSGGSYTAMENLNSVFQVGKYASGYWNGSFSNITVMKGVALDLCQHQELWNDGSPIDVREATFYSPTFIHWRLNSGDDPATSGGILDIIGNINASGVNAPTLDTELYPTN